MRMNKVEICGIETSTLKTVSEEKKRELLSLARGGDALAREELVMANLRLVLSVIQRFADKRKESVDDLFQVGCVGLIKAIDNFNLELDVKFSTYAVPMIIGEVRRYLRDNNAIRVSRGMRDLAYRALQVREKVSREDGREATLSEIAKALGESERDVGRAMEAIVEPASLYDSVWGEGEDAVYVIDQLKDDSDSGDAVVEKIALKEALKRLLPREKNIIMLRFYKGKTQMEIADEIGISQAQVSRIEKSALERLKKHLI